MYQVVVLKVISDIRSATWKIVAKRKIEILEKTRKSNAEIDYCQQGKNCQKLKNCNILYPSGQPFISVFPNLCEAIFAHREER